MRINNRTLLFGVFFIVVLLCVFSGQIFRRANAETESTEWKTYNACNDARDTVERQINSAAIILSKRESFRTSVEGWLAENAEDLRDGVRTTLIASGFMDVGAGTAALVNGTSDMMDGVALLSSFNSANSAISSQLGVISGIYTAEESGYNAVYDKYVDAYNNLSEEDKAIVKHATGLPNGIYPKMGSPEAETYGLVACGRPSSLSPTCYGYYKDADKHKETCTQKHGTSGETSVEWWSCFDSQCTRYPEHWVPCRATNCSVLFPPKTVIINTPDFPGGSVYKVEEYHDHEVKCQVDVYRGFFSFQPKCGEKYFTCEHSTCPKSNTHMSGATTPTDGTPNCPDCTTHCSSPCSCTNSGTCNGTASTPSTPTYHACGEHETSVSGDHSNGTYTCGSHSGYKCQESHDHKTYISSCTSTDSYGNTCNNTSGYYECSQHTHSYPAMKSCDAGHSYRADHPNVDYLNNLHRTRTCRFSGCGNSWQACSIVGWSPYCNNAYRKSQGWKCGE